MRKNQKILDRYPKWFGYSGQKNSGWRQQARQELQPPDSLLRQNRRQVFSNDFEIIGKGFKSNFKRQISEALHIKEKAPDLNIQKDAYRLSLYN